VIDANAWASLAWKLPTLRWIELSVKVTLANASLSNPTDEERQDAVPGLAPLIEHGVPLEASVEILKAEIVDG
jgi:hypothetical protein